MLQAVFGDAVSISSNYTFYAPFAKYMPPLISPYSWRIKSQILEGVNENYFTYTGDKAEAFVLSLYGLNAKVGKS